MRDQEIKAAITLLEAAGFRNYHNHEAYLDFDRWLNNDHSVVITLNQAEGTFYALYRASKEPGGEPETSPKPAFEGPISELTSEKVSEIVQGFSLQLVFPSADPEGESTAVTVQVGPVPAAPFVAAVQYPLRAMLDLSTEHLRPETIARLNALENSELPFSGGSTQYGWLVYAPHPADIEAHLKEYPNSPPEILEAMKKARELGADYVNYDFEASGDPDILPVFEH
jgi:hypothetical protein